MQEKEQSIDSLIEELFGGNPPTPQSYSVEVEEVDDPTIDIDIPSQDMGEEDDPLSGLTEDQEFDEEEEPEGADEETEETEQEDEYEEIIEDEAEREIPTSDPSTPEPLPKTGKKADSTHVTARVTPEELLHCKKLAAANGKTLQGMIREAFGLPEKYVRGGN